MKHLKLFEDSDFDYKMASNYLTKKFGASHVTLFQDRDKIYLFVEYNFSYMRKDVIEGIMALFKDLNYKFINPASGGIKFSVLDLDRTFLDELKIEMEANKYNL